MSSATPVALSCESEQPSETYYDQVDIFDYDQTIVAHPLMDSVKAAMIADLISLDINNQRDISILDAGTGSGQLARLILAFGFRNLELADIDAHSEAFCRDHPELSHVPFHRVDLAAADLKSLGGKHFDVVCLLGVFHHVPQRQRVNFLKSVSRIASHVLIGDEGILEYSCEKERKQHARQWYGFVISEAKRRRIPKLAAMEELFLKSDTSDFRGPNEDFKESPTAVLSYAEKANFSIINLNRIGNWSEHKGGMYTAVLRAR